MHKWLGKSIILTRCQMVVTTNASNHDWGGWWRILGQAGRPSDEARGFWLPQEQGISSNARELSGVLLTAQAASSALRGKQVLVETDNIITQAYVNHLGCGSPFLNNICQKLWSLCLHTASCWLLCIDQASSIKEQISYPGGRRII